MEEMTEVAKAAEARCGNDGGFLLYRQLDSTKLKAEAWKVFYLPGWPLSLPKGTQNWERNFYPE